GGLRIVQGLDFDRSPGTDVGGVPALVYNSDTVDSRPVVQAQLKSSADDPVPDEIRVRLTWDGKPQEWVTYQTTDLERGDAFLVAAQVEDAVARSGLYAWSLDIVMDFGPDHPESHAGIAGTARVVVDDSPAPDDDDPFRTIDFLGAGWGIVGIERLV